MMSNSQPTEHELLKTILEPLLEDFHYWFSRASATLKSERITFLTSEEQAALVERVNQTQQEVATAQMLYKLTGGQAGIDSKMLVPWHQLVAECWQISMRWRSLKNGENRGEGELKPKS